MNRAQTLAPTRGRVRQLDILRQAGAFTTMEVSLKTGASLRQLQWWDEQGVLSPSLGTIGHERAYSQSDIEKARHIAAMRIAGVSLRVVRRALRLTGWQQIQVIKSRHPKVLNGVLFLAIP